MRGRPDSASGSSKSRVPLTRAQRTLLYIILAGSAASLLISVYHETNLPKHDVRPQDEPLIYAQPSFAFCAKVGGCAATCTHAAPGLRARMACTAHRPTEARAAGASARPPWPT